MFHDLMKLCEDSGNSKCKFYYTDKCTSLNTSVRIFSYHYASYSDWLNDSALECRGIMFEMNEFGQPVRIMSRPMEKFFNYKENLFTMNLDLSQIDYVTVKADGSLISTYIDRGELFLKSKTSVSSPQALEAMEILNNEDNLLKRVKEVAMEGYTLNFEYVSPTNRIVLDYKQRSLILLNIRNNESGEYINYNDIFNDEILRSYFVERVMLYNFDNDWIDKVRDEKDIEGFVIIMKNGLKFKLKTTWYTTLHNIKDVVTQDELLFKAIISDTADDLKSLFEMDSNEYKRILKYEEIHKNYLNNSLELIEKMYDQYKNETRKEYAIQTQIRLKEMKKSYYFSLLMFCFVNGFDSIQVIRKLNEIFLKNHEVIAPQS